MDDYIKKIVITMKGNDRNKLTVEYFGMEMRSTAKRMLQYAGVDLIRKIMKGWKPVLKKRVKLKTTNKA